MRKVIMLPVAEQDLTVIVEYLAQFYESTALRQYDRIVKKIKELPLFPEKYEIYSAGQYRSAASDNSKVPVLSPTQKARR
ncbi:MAG: hypothetical protein KGZ54_02485 [Dethiobacter sp.]|nr:hypothetical protein [Dethiobacter sp.]MBS3900878.1 hypothetical protein [Dethiobacter sp.]